MSAEHKFKTGDKVRLKSGGSAMMVDWGAALDEIGIAKDRTPCVWFDESGAFFARTLADEVLEVDDRMTVHEFFASERGKDLLRGEGRRSWP